MKLILLSLLLASTVFADDQIYISVGKARLKRTIFAYPDSIAVTAGADSGEYKAFARTVRDVINNDLAFTGLFTIQSPQAFLEKPGVGLTLDQFKLGDWSTIGTEFLAKTGIGIQEGSAALELRLYNVAGAKQVMGKRYIAKLAEPRILAHTVANDIMEALTGKSGLFSSKVAMVCDKSGKKEIWQMDFDGSQPQQLTRHGSLAFAPAWSRDNKKIAYSVYMRNAHNIKNIDLYEMDLATRRSRLLSNRKGINSGAMYSPDGKHLAMTMSFLGNPEIFLLDLDSLEVQRLTKSLGFDVDPAFSPNGKKMAFVSSRSAQPHVYVMDIASSATTRITFAGKYNATPDWSPTGDRMVFAGYLEHHFDLFTINPDGTNLERLTKNEGSNEDPRISPDGQFIVFSSNRTGQKNIYIISMDGQYTKRLTFGLGNCEAPRWTYKQ